MLHHPPPHSTCWGPLEESGFLAELTGDKGQTHTAWASGWACGWSCLVPRALLFRKTLGMLRAPAPGTTGGCCQMEPVTVLEFQRWVLQPLSLDSDKLRHSLCLEKRAIDTARRGPGASGFHCQCWSVLQATRVDRHHGTASTNSNAMARPVLDPGTGKELSHQPEGQSPHWHLKME